MKELETIRTAGMHISEVAKIAISEAQNEDVFFTFNGLCVPVTKTSTVESICAEYDRLCEQARKDYEGSDEKKADQEAARQRKADAEQKFQDDVESLKTADEAALREMGSLWPKTPDALMYVFHALTERSHDYGTSAYAMSIFAEAAFNLMASTVGATGFQASCADLDFIKRTRHLKSPFAILDASQMLYPQYDLTAKAQDYVTRWREWAGGEAKRLLAEKGDVAAESVVAHWEMLATYAPQSENEPSASGESVSAEAV